MTINIKNKSIKIILIILSSLLIIDILINKGIFTAHDIETNLIYFGSFVENIKEGNLIPRWAGNVANLYGSPINMFFYPFSYYAATLFYLMGFSLINSIKIYIFITFIFSSLIMYIWLKNHLSASAAFIGAFLYVYAPYRINDIYARGSLAENTAFMFIPLVAHLLYKLWNKTNLRNAIQLSVIIALSLLSHPFIVIVFIPFYISYVLYLGINFKKILYLFVSSVLGLFITSFYTFPLILENKYTHYDISPFNGSGYRDQFISFSKLILPIWNFIDTKGKLEYQTYQIGILQIILFIIGIIIYLLIKNKWLYNLKIKKFYWIALINFSLSIFLMLPYANFVYKSVPLFQKIEFPWRYLSLNLFSLAIMSSSIYMIFDKNKYKQIIMFIIVGGGILLYLPYAKGHGYKNIADNFYLYEIKENTDGFATLPRWASQPELYPRINNRFVLLNGEANIETLTRSNTKHRYEIQATKGTKMMDATFYFPGWEVYIDGKSTEIEFQNPDYRGIITFDVPEGKHYVEVLFNSTKVRKLADLISLFTLFIMFLGYKYAKSIEKNINRITNI